MAEQNNIINEQNNELKNGGNSEEATARKKTFVEPAISVPVDVLEATTFFQAATSGVSNP